MSEELKPFPFCGKTSVHVSESFCGGWFAKCRECGAEIGSPHSEDEAKKNWNRRAQQPNEPLTLEELREMDGEPVWVESHGATSALVLDKRWPKVKEILNKPEEGETVEN